MDHHTGTYLLAGQSSAKADVETAWRCLWLPSALTVAAKAGDVVCAAVSSPVTSLWFLSLTLVCSACPRRWRRSAAGLS